MFEKFTKSVNLFQFFIFLLNRELKVEECDATKVDKHYNCWLQKNIL